jgi:hypothetical protein
MIISFGKAPVLKWSLDNRAFTFPPLYDKLPVIALNSPLQILPVIIKYTTGRDVRIPVGQIYSPGCRKYVFCKSACQLLNVSIAMSFPCVCVGLWLHWISSPFCANMLSYCIVMGGGYVLMKSSYSKCAITYLQANIRRFIVIAYGKFQSSFQPMSSCTTWGSQTSNSDDLLPPNTRVAHLCSIFTVSWRGTQTQWLKSVHRECPQTFNGRSMLTEHPDWVRKMPWKHKLKHR